MNVDGEHYRTIWMKPGDRHTVQIIDQQQLPHRFVVKDLSSVDDVRRAIEQMHVRGAGLIGVTAAYGIYIAALDAPRDNFDEALAEAGRILISTRPTAVNLEWAVRRQLNAMRQGAGVSEKIDIALRTAGRIADEDAEASRMIGRHGLEIIREISRRKDGAPVEILTHCNAGWLAFVDYGTATAPIYAAHDAGIDVHVWVDETRPRNQGSSLTAWEMERHGVPHDLVVDNAGGHLMQHGMVDMVLVGSDRTTRTGDVANKIGTYLKALAAHDNDIPFYVALPSSSIDFRMSDGLAEISIEERDPGEVKNIAGRLPDGTLATVLLCPEGTPARNYGFDVTPARLVTKLITERGLCAASEAGILKLFPEQEQTYS